MNPYGGPVLFTMENEWMVYIRMTDMAGGSPTRPYDNKNNQLIPVSVGVHQRPVQQAVGRPAPATEHATVLHYNSDRIALPQPDGVPLADHGAERKAIFCFAHPPEYQNLCGRSRAAPLHCTVIA